MKACLLLLLIVSFSRKTTAQLPDAATIKKHKIKIVGAAGDGGTEYYLYEENGSVIKQAYEDETFKKPNRTNRVYYNAANKPDSIITTGQYGNSKEYFFYGADGKYTQVYIDDEYAPGDADTSWYKKDGKISKTKDAYGRITKYDYSSKGRLLKRTTIGIGDEGTTVTTYTYDAAGKLISETRKDKEESSTTKYQYNKQGLLLKAIRSSGWTTTYYYTFR